MTHATAPTSTTTVYVHDLADHIIAELDASGQTQREYIWLDDMPVAVADNVASGNPVIYYVHVDHLMRPARMTAQDTSWVWDVIYAPFGGVSYIWSNPANIDLRFPGQWFQLESGLAYNWHRHYDATLGRYVQPDPIGLRGGRNLYGYVSGNPASYVDPQGQTQAGAITGGWIGSWVGGLGGGLIGPEGIIPGRWIGSVIGRAVGDWVTGPEVVLAVPAGPFWDDLEPCKGQDIRTNGLSGKKRRYYEKDYTHGDLEVYDRNGKHVGSADPKTGEIVKPPVKGRRRDVP